MLANDINHISDSVGGKVNSLKHGVNVDNLDEAVSPSDDFYQYACGGWCKNHPLPADYACYGTFTDVAEKNRKQIRDLVSSLSDNPMSSVIGSDAQKVADLYELGMDVERLNSEGAAPLMPFIERVKSFSPNDITSTVAWLNYGLTGVFFGAGISPDKKDSDRYCAFIGETGLTLGDRDYYLEDSDNNKKILDAYRIYVMRMMELVGYDAASAERVYNNVLSIETEIAKHKLTREQKRDPLKTYNILSIEEIEMLCPYFKWKDFFKAWNLNVEKANVISITYLEFLNEYLPSLSRQQLEDYMVYNVVTDSAGLLSDDFIDADFELFGKVMSGAQEQKPRWKRALAMTTAVLGEIVGKLYVEKYFPEQNKIYMLNLVENLRSSLGKHISELAWMTDATKRRALDKLSALRVKIGYPDKWKDYSGVKIDTSMSYLENVYNASLWFVNDSLSKYDRPVDKNEWFMYPSTVNAYYSPSGNEICFPAGILQPPYFDIEADDAVNYGAIGVVIGHEMTHGFDDQGRHFDKDGNLDEWWEPEDDKMFNTLADRLVEQFDEIEVAPGVKANGRFTLGENIADQGGLRVALTAYQEYAGNEGNDLLDGFTPLQRFYISYAGVWASNIREQEILDRTMSDPHSLGKNRVNVTLRNIVDFLDAFDIRAGSKMYRDPDSRVVIW